MGTKITYYRVNFITEQGRWLTRTVSLSEGYSTFADIPKILEILYGPVTIDSATLTGV